MPTKKPLGIAVLLLAARAHGLDRPVKQVQIETKFLEVGPGVISADFGLNFGHVYANFPSDLASGDRIAGTLAVVPSGKSEAERAANASTLGALSIEIAGAKFPVDGGLFVCPRVSPTGIDILLDIQPIARLLVQPAVTALPGQPVFVLPAAGVVAGRARILGPFEGSLDRTSVRIGDAAAHLVAESPRSCIFDVPAGPAGLTRIELVDNGRTFSGVFRIVGLRLTPPRPIIHTGDTTSFAAEVTGLAGLERPLPITIRNLSTDVVAMEGGDAQTLAIAPSEVTAAGTFALSRRLTGKRRGDYVVNVTIPWDEPGTAAR
jgi:hypothetical protein